MHLVSWLTHFQVWLKMFRHWDDDAQQPIQVDYASLLTNYWCLSIVCFYLNDIIHKYYVLLVFRGIFFKRSCFNAFFILSLPGSSAKMPAILQSTRECNYHALRKNLAPSSRGQISPLFLRHLIVRNKNFDGMRENGQVLCVQSQSRVKSELGVLQDVYWLLF